MAKVKKPSIHAPWRKRNIIPLWFFQLGFAGFQFAWSATLFGMCTSDGPDCGMSTYGRASMAITMVLGLVITFIIIASINMFSKFRLRSYDYQCGSIVTVVLGVVSMALIFSALDIFGGIFVACQVFFSIWLMIYAILVRRRVLKGKAQEMKRPVKNRTAGQADVELGNAKNAPSMQVDPPPPYRPPPQEAVSQKTVVGSVSETTRPSERPLATGGEANEPVKEIREFV